MTRVVAFLSDIHANGPALEAAVTDARAQGAQSFVCCGDTVGLGPSPNEVLDFLRTGAVPTVRGNVDHNVVRIVERQDKYLRKGKYGKYLSYGWTWNALTVENSRFLRHLPDEVRLQVEGVRILAVHGLPGGVDGGLTPATAHHHGEALLRRLDADVIVAGHTHHACVVAGESGFAVNCGTVGCMPTAPAVANYVLGTFAAGERPRFVIRWVPYDENRVTAAYEDAGLPVELKHLLLGRRSIGAVERAALRRACDEGRYRACA